MKKIILTFLGCLLLLITSGQSISLKSLKKRTLDNVGEIDKIAFGSCNNQDRKQDMWKYICKNKPDLWIWLGDNIYGDSEDMKVLRAKYQQQKSAPGYQLLQSICPVIGIWDDHDYGKNDGDKTYPKRASSKLLMLEFLDVPPDAEVRKREGAYQSYTLGKPGRQVKFILLDERYFRDELVKDTLTSQRYFANRTGDILGEVQWAWLEKELAESEAELNIIGSGIQIIPEQHDYEKWANFPVARKRFFDLLVKTQAKNTLILSGDRHIAEVSRIDLQGLGYTLYEVTSSGLTHTWSRKGEEPNRWRSGDLIIKKNFGILDIDWSASEPKVRVEIRGEDNKVYLEQQIDFN